MKQKVFSYLESESNNYNDYLKMKCGETILKDIKKRNNNACINFFLNYQDFLNLTKSYYKYLHYPSCSKHLLTNMYETNQSFIHTQYPVLLNHLNTCNQCTKVKVESLENIQCNQLLNILYPYGVYDDRKESNIYFPNQIKLKDWCANKKNIKTNCYHPENFIDTFIVNDFPLNKKTNSACGLKYNLCNNTKPLFI
jgi:hypothetical protein